MIKAKTQYGKTVYINRDNISYISVNGNKVTIFFVGGGDGIPLDENVPFNIQDFLPKVAVPSVTKKRRSSKE